MIKSITLNNGIEMPLIGLGTFPNNGLALALTVRKAVAMGYRSFDTASAYANEKWLGRGLLFSGKRRTKMFITSKLSNTEQRNGDVRGALKGSLSRLGLKYLDLYLMHWPNPETYLNSWKEMEQLYKEGLVRAIGVCNFHEHHLNRLLEVAEVMPAINQVELHPLLSQAPLVGFCKKAGIAIAAYSPLARMHEKLIQNETLVGLAAEYGKRVSQIILRWDYQHRYVALPKSSNPERQNENIDLFDFCLSGEEMSAIDGLNMDFRVRHNPDTCDFSQL